MAEETSEYSGTAGDGIGRFGEMSMDVQIAKASGISGIVECVTELPEPAASFADKVYQLIAVQPPYVMGRFYKCVSLGGSYSWSDVSRMLEFYRAVEPVEFFRLDGNEVRFKWADASIATRIGSITVEVQFIKTEIQLVHHDTTGAVKSVKTIFTESVMNSYRNGAVVTVDDYTARGIAQGKIKLRTLSTYVGLVYICNLPKVS